VGRSYSGYTGVNGGIILKRFLKKWVSRFAVGADNRGQRQASLNALISGELY